MITLCLISYCKYSKKQPPTPLPQTTPKKRRNIRNILRCQTHGSGPLQHNGRKCCEHRECQVSKQRPFFLESLVWDPNQVVIPLLGQVPKQNGPFQTWIYIYIYICRYTCWKLPNTVTNIHEKYINKENLLLKELIHQQFQKTIQIDLKLTSKPTKKHSSWFFQGCTNSPILGKSTNHFSGAMESFRITPVECCRQFTMCGSTGNYFDNPKIIRTPKWLF